MESGGNDDDEDPRPKQTRRTLSDLARDFIDEYLDTYISLSGEPKARARLYLEILAQSQTRKETLDSEGWDVPLIQKRLQNALAKKNLAARRAEADE